MSALGGGIASARQLRQRWKMFWKPSPQGMRVLARQRGRFGLIRVLERHADGARIFCINDGMQSLQLQTGVSGFGYVHAAYVLLSHRKKLLIVGGGGGDLASMCARRNAEVTVLDVDPAAAKFARRYFNLDPRVRWITVDALDFFATTEERFDAVFIDACDGEGLVVPFNDAQTLIDVWTQACPAGDLAVNVTRNADAPRWGEALAGKLAWRGLHATLYRASACDESNEVLLLSQSTPPKPDFAGQASNALPQDVQAYLKGLFAFTPPVRALANAQ